MAVPAAMGTTAEQGPISLQNRFFLQEGCQLCANPFKPLVGGGWGNVPPEQLARRFLGEAVRVYAEKEGAVLGIELCETLLERADGFPSLKGCTDGLVRSDLRI